MTMSIGTIDSRPTRPNTMSEMDRLKGLLVDPRDATAAVQLAQAALPKFDPVRHHLTRKPTVDRMPSEMSYPAFFREVALDRFVLTRNVAGAAHILDILLAEQADL